MMSSTTKLLARVPACTRSQLMRSASTKASNDGSKQRSKNNEGEASNLSRLQDIIGNMKVEQRTFHTKHFKQFGHSDLFNYATNSDYPIDELKKTDLSTWNSLLERDLRIMENGLPLNGFEELIQLTEQGKIWKYPIDNEQGMNEKDVPFEEHVFLDDQLEGFPKVDFVQQFMGHVLSGLAKNHWMTVERKREVIKFYKDYFNGKRDMYKVSGVEI